MNEYYAEQGENIYYFINRVQKLMREKRQNYAHCIFNDIRFGVSEDSNANDIYVIYNLKGEINRMKRT